MPQLSCYNDCLGTDTSLAESKESGQPGQSVIHANLPQIRAEHLVRSDIISTFLAAWSHFPGYEDLVLELRFKHSTRINPHSGARYTFSIYRTIQEILSPRTQVQIAFHAERGYDVYIGVQPRYQKLGRRSGGNADIPKVFSLYLDADEWTQDNLETHLRTYQLPQPSIVISSGHGLHLWWMLKNSINPELARQAQRYLVQIKLNRTRIAEENASDLARILRLPDTINWKDPDRPLPVQLLSVTAARYDWTEVLGGCIPAWANDPKILNYQWSEPKPVKRLAPLGVGAQTAVRPDPICGTNTQQRRRTSQTKSKKLILSANTFGLKISKDQRDYYSICFRLFRTGQRHQTLMALSRRLVNDIGANISEEQVETVHDYWFAANQSFISSSIESSKSDMIRMVRSLLRSYDPSRKVFQIELYQHPRLNIIPKGKRYKKYRDVANVIHSGWCRYGNQFFMSYGKLANMFHVSKDTISRILRVLQRSGLIFMLRKGDRESGKASFWTTDASEAQRYHERQQRTQEKTITNASARGDETRKPENTPGEPNHD